MNAGSLFTLLLLLLLLCLWALPELSESTAETQDAFLDAEAWSPEEERRQRELVSLESNANTEGAELQKKRTSLWKLIRKGR
ncbi:hypothetical protein AOXY_G26892 [Acipenser oxyrinchus oxyrinchus]|uniref:Uncharacterized protein n=1 Tax=Acipenser oxyrinchus oxyrinchus TaxID=40147 RepID=A0AAD8CPS1_ACIOX|nr:hypothetical protein AOXY_G26892 [Acipenser oxyrinchus oxyrinchus]